jgi:hypothetical protein
MGGTLGAAALIVLGWLLGLPTALFTEWLRRRREKSDRQASRQYETLIALQESLLIIYQTAVAGYLDDRGASRAAGTGEWIHTLPSSEDNQKEFQARGRIVMLRVRVEDAELGKLIDAVMQTAGKFLIVDSEQKAKALIQELLDRHNAVNQRIGALVTKTY